MEKRWLLYNSDDGVAIYTLRPDELAEEKFNALVTTLEDDPKYVIAFELTLCDEMIAEPVYNRWIETEEVEE